MDVRLREDVGRFGHEMNAAEDDELGSRLIGGPARELEAVAGEVRKLDDGVLLVVMAQHDQTPAEGILGRLDAKPQLGIGQLPINFRKRLLPGRIRFVAQSHGR